MNTIFSNKVRLLHSSQLKLPGLLLRASSPEVAHSYARYILMSTFCETAALSGMPCGECASCGSVFRGDHPDILEVGRNGEDSAKLNLLDIHRLLEHVSFSPEDRGSRSRRCAVLYGADTMNIHCSNALLKTLEEPPVDSTFILTASRPRHVLKTIRSRCREWSCESVMQDADLAMNFNPSDLQLRSQMAELMLKPQSPSHNEVAKVLENEALDTLSPSKLLELCELSFNDALRRVSYQSDNWMLRTTRRQILTHAKALARKGSIAINVSLFLENFLYGEGLDVWN